MKRLYTYIIQEHFELCNKMLFLTGPRQVGKTTLAKSVIKLFERVLYLNWDNEDHQRLILSGPSNVIQHAKTELNSKRRKSFKGKQHDKKNQVIIIFDEIHKYSRWKNYIKGFFDTYKDITNIIITGSAKLDIYRQGGDSMKGRYFLHRIHPFSVAELARTNIREEEICAPKNIGDKKFNDLYRYGGFPEPFIASNQRFLNKWKGLCHRQLFREDIRDLSRVEELAKLELLARMLDHRAGQLLNCSDLSKKVLVSMPTIKHWIKLLTSMYYCFAIQPWHKNLDRALIKQPKVFLWDWSGIEDLGVRAENFIAAHLLKAVHFWTDHGLGQYNLYFIRDKSSREVDFLVTKDDKPWFLVEVKLSLNSSISEHLYYFQKKTGAKHAFQVVIDLPYINQDCFQLTKPTIVSARTFLSQLV